MSSSPTEHALIDVTMPQMGVSVAEGTVVAWRVEVGDRIEAEQTICEISTDKIDTEVPAPVERRGGRDPGRGRRDGRGRAWCWPGSRSAMARGPAAATALARGGHRYAAPAPPAPPARHERTARPALLPVVQRIAAEHGIDLAAVVGTGRDGRVRKQDVLALVNGNGVDGAPAVRGPAAAHREPLPARPGPRRPPSPAAGRAGCRGCAARSAST